MTTEPVIRRYLFKLYPSAAQDAALHEQRMMMADLWNALLQRNEDMRRLTKGNQRGVTHAEGKGRLTFFDMTNEITRLRAECPEWRALSVWSAHRVAKALDLAFQAFFRRAKQGAGAQSGYPRFRARRKATTVPHRSCSGCKLTPRLRERSDGAAPPVSPREWRLALKGVPGPIRARGEFPLAPTAYKDADVIWRDECWWFSVCVEVPARRSAGNTAITISFDLIDEFARVERAEGRRTARDGSARAATQSPNHLNTMAEGTDTDENAGSEVRDEILTRPAAQCPADTDENAGSEVRACDRRSGLGERISDTDENAGSEVRVLLAEMLLHVALPADTDENAGSEVRAYSSRTGTTIQSTTDTDENAGSEVRVQHLGGAAVHRSADTDENAGSEVRDEVRQGGFLPRHADTDENAGSEVRVDEYLPRKRPSTQPDIDENAGSEVRVLQHSFRRAAHLCDIADTLKSDRDTRYPRKPFHRPSWRWRRETRRAARLTSRAARIRREAIHIWSSAIVSTAADLTIHSPPVKSMTASPRGDAREWGANVEAVSRLNRNSLNQAPALAVQMLRYKAAEAGIRCDVVTIDDAPIVVGPDLVKTGKLQRRARRALRKAA